MMRKLQTKAREYRPHMLDSSHCRVHEDVAVVDPRKVVLEESRRDHDVIINITNFAFFKSLTIFRSSPEFQGKGSELVFQV